MILLKKKKSQSPGAVYDVSDFLHGHPGGSERLAMAAGEDLEKFWSIYRLHYRGHIISFLEKYRIGNLSAEDRAKIDSQPMTDPYVTDPPRHPDNQPCILICCR